MVQIQNIETQDINLQNGDGFLLSQKILIQMDPESLMGRVELLKVISYDQTELHVDLQFFCLAGLRPVVDNECEELEVEEIIDIHIEFLCEIDDCF